MTRTSKLTGYYVTARIDPGTANARRAWLLGPYWDERSARSMIEPVRLATRYLDDPAYRLAHFSVERRKALELPFGSLPLALLRQPDVFSTIVNFKRHRA